MCDRILRTYEVMCARTFHFCDHCFKQICPGESYRGSVLLYGHRITVLKEHLFCEPDPWDREDWDSDKGDDSIPDISPTEPAELPMAA